MDEELLEALGAVRAFVAGREPLGDTLSQLAVLAVGALAADAAGLTLLYPDGRARTAVSTAEIANRVDQAQYDADRGPCLDAFRLKTTVRVEDTRQDRRWPEFAATAAANEVYSTLSLPLLVSDAGIGALNLYSHRVGNFSEADERQGELLAAQAAVALANAQAYVKEANRAEQLAQALESRAVIEQAKGVIMASTGVSADEASTSCGSSRRPRTASCARSRWRSSPSSASPRPADYGGVSSPVATRRRPVTRSGAAAAGRAWRRPPAA